MKMMWAFHTNTLEKTHRSSDTHSLSHGYTTHTHFYVQLVTLFQQQIYVPRSAAALNTVDFSRHTACETSHHDTYDIMTLLDLSHLGKRIPGMEPAYC